MAKKILPRRGRGKKKHLQGCPYPKEECRCRAIANNWHPTSYQMTGRAMRRRRGYKVDGR
jgi:hypothetical protein